MQTILDRLTSPEQVRDLSFAELHQLAADLRREIIDRVSQNGGHLASNLGTIELTLAMLRSYAFRTDRVIWDVGHQSYAYKILTGRREAFRTLRRKGGLSGFPKREESPYDAFNTGHSTTSISAALGMARGMRRLGKPGSVIAVIGDGAMTGGMAYEALNNITEADHNLIIVLNDNQMSIDPNVGSVPRHLEHIRVKPRYLRLKDKTERALRKWPLIGGALSHFMSRVKRGMRRFVRPGNIIFEAFQLRYYGPVDGHDIPMMVRYFNAANHHAGPVLLHVVTQKGRGYLPAEAEPADYHGVAPFVIEDGIAPKLPPEPWNPANPMNGCQSFSDAFSVSVLNIAERCPELMAITAAMASGTGLMPFARRFPDRFFDVGIAEQHAVTMAAGLATQGFVPVVAIYATFLQRAVDQILHDVVYQNLHVVFAIDRAGVVGSDGETHQGLYDRAFLSAMPHVTILEPRDFVSLQQMLAYAVEQCEGPVFVRYPRGGSQCPAAYRTAWQPIQAVPLPKAEIVIPGRDVTLIAAGNTVGFACAAAERISADGISAEVVDCRVVKPLDLETISQSIRRTGACIVLEEAVPSGSVASQVAQYILDEALTVRWRHLSVADHPVEQASQAESWASEQIDAEACYRAAVELAGGGSAGKRKEQGIENRIAE